MSRSRSYPVFPVFALSPSFPKRWGRDARLLLLIVFACFAIGAASGQSTQTDQSVSIRGTVVNSVTHEPIGRAQVYSQDNRFATMTDDQGHFEVPAPQQTTGGNGAVGPDFVLSGSHFVFSGSQLTARKPGFLVDKNERGQNIEVTSGASDLTISLIPEAILLGRIALSGTDSPDGIPVQLFRREISDGLAHWILQTVANTNSKGEYRFAELYAGDYRVGTREVPDRDPDDFTPGGKMYGYPPVYFPGASDVPSATTIHLSQGKVFQADFSLARRQYYPVKISIANGLPPGTPINVNVSVQEDGAPGYSLGYNAADHTIAGSLPNGTYVVEAATFSQQGATGLMNLRVANGPALDGGLTLLPNGSIPVQIKEEFTLMTTSEGNDEVFVSDSIGRSMRIQSRHRYLNVFLEPISDFGQGRGASLRPQAGPNDESLAIENVQLGRYWVRVNSSRGYAAAVTSGGSDLLHEPLVVGPRGSSSPIEITMRDDTASFDGEVEGATGGIEGATSMTGQTAPQSYPPFAYIYCIPEPGSPGQFTQLYVSSDGKFNSPQMAPGAYRILAFRNQQNDLEYRNAEAMRAYESKGQLLRLVAGQREHLRIQLISKADEDAE